MVPFMSLPAPAGFNASLRSNDVEPAPRIVIYQPDALCAEALEAVVHKHTRWRVACATTHVGVATAAAIDCGATALIFEVRTGTAAGASALIRRLRLACPDVALMLLTQHTGAGFIGRAAAEGVSIVDKRQGVTDFRAALEALATGQHCPNMHLATREHRHRVGTMSMT